MPSSAGAGNGTAGTVTIATSVNPNSITFNPTGDGNPYTINGGYIGVDANSSGMMPITVNANATIASNLTGNTNGLTIRGNATLSLGGSNTYPGGTTITSGTLASLSQNALGTGPVTLNGGALQVQGGIPGLLQGELGPGNNWANWTGTPTSWTPVLGPVNAYAFNGTAPYAPWYNQTTWVYQWIYLFPRQ